MNDWTLLTRLERIETKLDALTAFLQKLLPDDPTKAGPPYDFAAMHKADMDKAATATWLPDGGIVYTPLKTDKP